MEKKQSSVEWLVEAIMKYDKSFKEFYGAEIEQAKAMHQEEKKESYDNGYANGQMDAFTN